MNMTAHLNRNLLSLAPSGIRRFTALARSTPDCAMLTIGEPDFDTPEAIKAAAIAALNANRTHYPQNAGDPDVRIAIAAHERDRYGLDYSPDEVLLTCGASEAIYTAITGTLNPGDEIIIPRPAFGLYESIARLAGARIVPLDTAPHGFQIDERALCAAITPNTRMIVLNSPNNPTGTVLTQASLDAVTRAIGDQPIFVLTDEVYEALSYVPCPHMSGTPQLRDRLMVVKSFSKPYAMTGWRMGYLLCDAPVMERLKLLHASAVVSVASFSQPACIEALKTDTNGMREIFCARRDLICERLRAMGLPFAEPGGAFYVFVDISRFGMNSESFCLKMIQDGRVAGVPGSCFGSEGYVRFSYCYSDAEITCAMDRLEAFIHSL